MGFLHRYAADTAMPIQVVHAILQQMIIRVARAYVQTVSRAIIAKPNKRDHALQVRMGILHRYAAVRALLVVPILRDRRRIIVLARAIVYSILRALTVSIAMQLRALVMELLRIMELASVIRVTGVMIARKAMRA